MPRFRGVCIGAGYFSKFQYEAWTRIPQVEITALCNRNMDRARPIMEEFGVGQHYTDYREMLEAEQPDFLDVITQPPSHLEMCRFAGRRGIHVICQKPLAPTFDEAKQIVADVREAGIRFMVHENFRFQPWHREIKRLLGQGAIGEKLHSLTFRSRPGDGWVPVVRATKLLCRKHRLIAVHAEDDHVRLGDGALHSLFLIGLHSDASPLPNRFAQDFGLSAASVASIQQRHLSTRNLKPFHERVQYACRRG